MKNIFMYFVVAAAAVASAYLPPVEELNGVRVEIESFPQAIERPAGSPYNWPLGVTHVAAAKAGVTVRSFPVTLANGTAKPVAGRLDVWLNDDWTVTGPSGALTLAAGERKTLTFTATATPRALNALYPVHARFTPAGCPVEQAPHPIAIFKFDHPKAPRALRPKSASRPVIGPQPKPVASADRAALAQEALAAANRARTDGTDAAAGQWQLVADDAIYGAGVAYGPRGLVDGALAFSDGEKSVVFNGFTAQVAGSAAGRQVEPQAEIRDEKGTLRIRWSLGDVKMDAFGEPRLAKLAVGAASERPKRVYAGFGSVFQDPKRFTMEANGFLLSTRHVGVDYANGLSVVQAVDVVPDRFVCDGEKNVASLHAHHDATFTFVPSAKGSFAAARRFRAVSGYKASPGHDALGSRMCLDQWGGDYRKAAADLARAAKYGLTDSIFVKHVWQRWGYDYRLPEIYPPANDPEGFGLMREACRQAGMLFCPHDNYTDIYPDADNYSYDLVVFNLDGTPQLAWFNAGRHARSYRWAPHAFHPWALRNAKLLKAGYDPEAIFIDVFTAHGPFDYLDRQAHFHSKNETSASWAKGFAMYREGFRNPRTVCVSEAGQDHLVGVADAGQSDHFMPRRLAPANAYGDAERTPWHDIVTHGYYVLFAGGLGGRYAEPGWQKGGDRELNGYASDDYLSNCIIGGRNPMCDGPFSRDAVKTYWLQHDACAELGRAEFLDLAYDGDNVHRQHATFSAGGEVWINRATNGVWQVPGLGVTLPSYGYYAKTATTTSGIVEKDGVRYAFAKSPTAFFVDARTPVRNEADVVVRVVRGDSAAADRVRVTLAWETRRVVEGYQPFVHICKPTWKEHEGIVFQGIIRGGQDLFRERGRHTAEVEFQVPAETPEGEYDIWFGAWSPKGLGPRLVLAGERQDGPRRRMSAGILKVARGADARRLVTWMPDKAPDEACPRDRLLGVNRARRAVDFGGIVTDGSFRFVDGTTIIPLPQTAPFAATIDLASVGAKGRTLARVETLDPEAGAKEPSWEQTGDKISLKVDAKAFAYRLVFK